MGGACRSPGLSTPPRPAPASTHLCHPDDPFRRRLPSLDDITRPHFSRHDHALCRRGPHRSPPRVRHGARKASASGSPAENIERLSASRPGRRHRRLALRSTCARNVPSCLARRGFTHFPRPALQPPHQNPRPSTQTPDTLRMGTDWPVMSAIWKLLFCKNYDSTQRMTSVLLDLGAISNPRNYGGSRGYRPVPAPGQTYHSPELRRQRAAGSHETHLLVPPLGRCGAPPVFATVPLLLDLERRRVTRSFQARTDFRTA